jgi:hypothetical protein
MIFVAVVVTVLIISLIAIEIRNAKSGEKEKNNKG